MRLPAAAGFVLVLALAGCAGRTPAEPPRALPPAVAAAARAGAPADPGLVEANNLLGLTLARRLRQDQPAENLAVSPYSVALALHMAYAGAAGDTRQAMGAVLGLERLAGPPGAADAVLQAALADDDPKVGLTVANSVWAKAGVPRPEFLDLNRTHYGAEVGDLAQGPGAVNAWVARATGGLIPALLPPGSNCLAYDLLLVNALAVRAEWSAPFNPARTGAGTFTRLDASQAPCAMMRRTGILPYAQTDRWQAVRLGLGQGGRYGLLLVLPAPGISLADLAASLDVGALRRALGNRQVALALPRFTCAWTGDLAGPLGDLGMGVAFDPARADFSAMAATPQVMLRVMHAARVQVDEHGLLAAAGTGVQMAPTALPSRPLPLTFDRPFLFALVDGRTGMELFVGQVTDPAAGS